MNKATVRPILNRVACSIAPVGDPERITYHGSAVGFPVMLDERTLMYTATGEDGAGAALYAMNVERGIAHRVSSGLEEYNSVAASRDGRRLVATVTNPSRHLWSVPLSDRVVEESECPRVPQGRRPDPTRLRDADVPRGGGTGSTQTDRRG